MLLYALEVVMSLMSVTRIPMMNALGRLVLYFRIGRTFRGVLTKGCLRMCDNIFGYHGGGGGGERVVIQRQEPRMLSVLR